MNNLKQLIDANTTALEFPLLGQVYTVSPQRRVFHELKKKYNSLLSFFYTHEAF